MALTVDIPLCSPFVIISGAESILGIQVSAQNIQFGVVEQIFAGCMKCEVGKSVCFNTDGSVNFNVDQNTYLMINENSIYFTENPPM